MDPELLNKKDITFLILSRGTNFSHHLFYNLELLKEYSVVVFSANSQLKTPKGVLCLKIDSDPETISDKELEEKALQTFLRAEWPKRLVILHEYELIDIKKFEQWLMTKDNFNLCASARFAACRPFKEISYVEPKGYPSVIYLNLRYLDSKMKGEFFGRVTRQFLQKSPSRAGLLKLIPGELASFEGVVIGKEFIIWDLQFVGTLEIIANRCKFISDIIHKDFDYELPFLFPDDTFIGVDIFGNSNYLVVDRPDYLKEF